MAYMNLLIRERADLADSPDEYKKDVEVADGWVQKSPGYQEDQGRASRQQGGRRSAGPAVSQTDNARQKRPPGHTGGLSFLAIGLLRRQRTGVLSGLK